MDQLAATGIVGRASNVPAHLPARIGCGDDESAGLRPEDYYTGRAPLEAAAQGIQLGPRDWAIRCNLVTIEDQVMRDFTAGHIQHGGSACSCSSTAQRELGAGALEFVPGVSYRNLLIYRGEESAGAVFVRDPLHSATRSDRQDGHRRLSAGTGQ